MIRRVLPSHNSARRLACIAGAVCLAGPGASGQASQSTATDPQQLQRLEQAMAAVQAQLAASQQQLLLLQQQVAALKAAQTSTSATLAHSPAASSDAVEQQGMEASQIATLDQVKVESDSKYPVKLSGLILLNAFANSGAVDQVAAPTSAFFGGGATGLSLRQTVLGVDARGPHLAGAESRADLRVDFFGSSLAGGYSNGGGLLRLRTAHASLRWARTEAFFALDRTLLNPNTPTSLTAVAQPGLAWSGNLWSWNPQVGLSHTSGERKRVRVEAAWIQPEDPAVVDVAASTSGPSQPSLAERSRLPGVEARVAVLGSSDTEGPQVGVGGYFARHGTPIGKSFDAWAATLDLRTPLWQKAELTGSLYRGQALGGLGGGGYKDYVVRPVGSSFEVAAPKDVGGWLQFKQRFNDRLEWNSAFGMDNIDAGGLRPYSPTASDVYSSIARNRTATSNVIFSPRAYLQLSFEYRHLTTWPVSGAPWNANIYGLAAGYRF